MTSSHGTSRLIILAAALAALAGACSVNSMPFRDPWYAQHYFIMQDYEQAAYKALPEASRPAFQELFWKARAPQSKAVFDARIAAILVQFKNENSNQPWNTDRARVFLLNGRPDGFEQKVNTSWGSTAGEGGRGVTGQERTGEDIQAATLEVWTYRYGQFLAEYGFTFQPPNRWKQSPTPSGGGRYVGALETQSRAKTFGVVDEAAYRKALDELRAVK